MRIAVSNSYPNHAVVAETELIQRILIAGRNLGWDMREVVTSDDIHAFHPDCVLATHFNLARLTPFTTIGVMFNPPEYFAPTSHFVCNVLTYDGFLPGSPTFVPYLRDLAFAAGKSMPIADFPFVPATQRTDWVDRAPEPRHLFYVGTRWDTQRHGTLLENLNKATPFHVYGPAQRWAGVECDYRGEIPADGVSVLSKIRQAGIALCIHSKEHRHWNLPSMRVFEAAAAGAVIIADAIPMLDAVFGDAILRIDLSQSETAVIEQVVAHVRWINNYPEEAAAKARQANALFNRHFALEDTLRQLPSFVESIRCRQQPRSGPVARLQPCVEYLVRCGGQSHRALKSLADQTYRNIGVIALHSDSEPAPDLNPFAGRFASCRVISTKSPASGPPSLWAGLPHITAPFFGCIDAEVSLQPDHVASLIELFLARSRTELAHSATVELQTEPQCYFQRDNFTGPLGKTIEERRRLAIDQRRDDLASWPAEAIASGSWLARTELIDAEILDDPELDACEDLYLILMLQKNAKRASTWRPTCEVAYRKPVASDAQRNALARIRRRCCDPSVQRVVEAPLPPAAELLPPGIREVLDDTSASEWRVLMRFAKIYLALRGCAKLVRRPLRMPRRFVAALTLGLRHGPRRLFSRLAAFGRFDPPH